MQITPRFTTDGQDPFAAFAVLTTDGRAINGLLIEQNDKEVVLKTAEKKVMRVGRADIAELRKKTLVDIRY